MGSGDMNPMIWSRNETPKAPAFRYLEAENG